METDVYTYYDEHKVLCYYIGTYNDFIRFLKENPEYSK